MKCNNKPKQPNAVKNNLTLIVFIFLIIIMFTASFSMYRKVSSIKGNSISGENYSRTKDGITHITKSIFDAWSNDGFILETSMMPNFNFDESIIDDCCFPEDSHLLMCRISENNCESCVEYLLNNLNALASDTTFKMNIVVLGEYSDMALKILRKRLTLDEHIKTYSVNGHILPIDKQGNPYLFVMDKEYRVSNVYTPDRINPKLTIAYIDLLKRRYQ